MLPSKTQGNYISCVTLVYNQLMHMEEWGEATCLAWQNAVDVLAVRHVKQGTETAGLRTRFARTYLCVCCDIYMPLDAHNNRIKGFLNHKV